MLHVAKEEFLIHRMKCTVEGLPHGLYFKQPAKYTAPELRQIKGNIKFLLQDSEKYMCIPHLKTDHEECHLMMINIV